jgi:hypothetical protein
MLLGVVGFAGATVWWYLFFEQLLGESVKEASECFYATTLQCEVGNLVGQVGDLPPYDPNSLYASAAVFVVGVFIYGLSNKRK